MRTSKLAHLHLIYTGINWLVNFKEIIAFIVRDLRDVSKHSVCGQDAKFVGAFANFRKATVSFVMSVCQSAWNNSAPTGRILVKFDI